MKTKATVHTSRPILYSGIIAVCFFYTGSAYMSQFYRLMDLYDGRTVDLITSCWNYALQAVGIWLFMAGLRLKPKFMGNRWAFIVFLLSALPFMVLMQLSNTAALVAAAGYVFNLHIGLYFGFYLTLFAQYVPVKHAALSFGAAYAVGSVGTYLLSLLGDGAFLMSKKIVVLYVILAGITMLLVYLGDSYASDTEAAPRPKSSQSPSLHGDMVSLLVGIVAIMMVISVIGSGLYYSLPQAEGVDWNLIRAFYAAGLVGAGIVMDKKRWIGEILVAMSLIYPLIAFALIGEGLNGTVTLAFSYLFRGALTIYYVISFTDLASLDKSKAFLAPLGLSISRMVEAVLTLILMVFDVPNVVQILMTAIFTVPLIILLVQKQNRFGVPAVPMSEEKRKALFAEKYSLTQREAQILDLIEEGLTDDEISARIHISNSTVRFHISNILKKTGTSSRVEAIRALQKFN